MNNMIIVIGGAYQGKLKYVMDHYTIEKGDVFDCENQLTIDYDKRVLYNFDKYILGLLENDMSLEKVYSNIEKFKNRIIIVNDISSGVVPIDDMYRKWREENGKVLNFLCQKADTVIRVFCGIGTVIK